MEAVYIKSDVQEEYFSDCTFQDGMKSEIDVTHTFDYVKSEDTAIKYQPIETVSCSVVTGEGQQHIQIKKDIKDEYLCDFANESFQIVTERNEVDSINTVDGIKCEVMDMKYESLDDDRLSSENVETLSVTYNQICDEVSKANDILKYKQLNLMDGKTSGSSFEMKHKDNAEKNITAKLYQCNSCLYKTRRKSNLREHVLVHMDPSKIEKYKCNICSFKTRWKRSLQNHEFLHTQPSETAKFECGTCPYRTQWKSNLRKHMLAHTDPSKTDKFECNICLYKTRWKASLRRHILVHMDASETEKYQCNICPYKTRWKSNLQEHSVIHTDHSKILKYECSTCPYKARLKSNLRQHMLLHTDPSKTPTFECYVCGYTTRRKSNLRGHVSIHMDSKYECNVCSYKARRKYHLERHMLGHTNPPKPVKRK